jgi:lipoate---protein ligase
MKFIDNGNETDPTLNLALEEYMLNQLDLVEPYLLFYINRPSIIIGRNQNAYEEVNLPYVRKHELPVVRRLSGGGAVYHDLGNLNFSFLTRHDGDSFRNFERFTQPVVDALQSLGARAELKGRNDLLIDDKKISGNAQFSTQDRMFSHGTLMFDVNPEDVAAALRVNRLKLESKGIKSIRSRVTNIRPHLAEDLTIFEFRDELLRRIFHVEDVKDVPRLNLTSQDWMAVRAIQAERYGNWEWNYGRSPDFNVRNMERFHAGTIDIRLNVRGGIIQESTIYGDFFGTGEVHDVAGALIGVRLEESSIRQALESMNLSKYFGEMDLDTFVAFVAGVHEFESAMDDHSVEL